MGDDLLGTKQFHAEQPQTDESQSSPELLDLFGGEPLEGSGFESEVPDSSSSWRGSE